MFVELIEQLRCPHPHEESQLIASASRTEARHIVEGVLGCPLCGAEFPITRGVARFSDPEATVAPQAPSAEMAMRLAAFLDLTDANGFALLCGRWGAQADAILRLADARLVLVNPPPNVRADVAAGVVVTRDIVPFAAGSARALALDEGMPSLTDSAVGAVRTGGRVVGPSALGVPAGVTELTRDAHTWVAQRNAAPDRDAAPRLVALTRAPR